MDILRMEEMPLQPTPLGGKARIIIEKPEVKLVNLVVEAGDKVLAHDAPVDVIFIVLEGRGSMLVEKENVLIEAGQVAMVPAGLSRQINADKDEGLKLLVVRSPNK